MAMSPAASIDIMSESRGGPRGGLRSPGQRPALVVLRPAARDDCARIARLMMIASDGVAAYTWSRIDAPELSLIEIGEQRFAQEDRPFSYRNALVAEREGAVVGMMVSFPMEPRNPDAPNRRVDPVLAPYAELEDPGSLYVAALALFHEHRGLGIGTRLLAEARRRARDLGLDRLSLICFEKNAKALHLYRRLGFRELARRPVVPHPFLKYREGAAILLACPNDELDTD